MNRKKIVDNVAKFYMDLRRIEKAKTSYLFHLTTKKGQ